MLGRIAGFAVALGLVHAHVLVAPSALSSEPPARIELRAPQAPNGLRLTDEPLYDSLEVSKRIAIAVYNQSPIYSQAGLNGWSQGYVRRGDRLSIVADSSVRRGCDGGRWYEVVGGGFICTGRGFRLASKEIVIKHPIAADTTSALPFKYARVTNGAPYMRRVPSAAQAEQIDRAMKAKAAFPKLVERRVRGLSYIAIDKVVTVDDRKYVRSKADQYFRAEDLTPISETKLIGEPVSDERPLPIAFVTADDAPIHCDPDSATVCGAAERYARFSAMTVEEARVQDAEGRWLDRASVRVAAAIERPRRIADDESWLHIDLSEQTMVAYEGDHPIFATLVSTGKGRRHATKRGTHRMVRKFISQTLNGPDPEYGSFRIAEVPWIAFYDDDFGIHTAYWHDNFGEPSSHGCTNMSPTDARWLFDWSGPLPRGWYGGNISLGVWVHITS